MKRLDIITGILLIIAVIFAALNFAQLRGRTSELSSVVQRGDSLEAQIETLKGQYDTLSV
jgi:biopolymer transport protein ExbB/TolQ